MATPDLTTLQPGDILRGTVARIDADADACILDAGAHGTLLVPLAGLADSAVARLVPGAGACVQVLAGERGAVPPRASASIEFSGRTSVLVLDGTAVVGDVAPCTPTVFVSKKLSGVRRAELATRMEAALADESCGLPAMLGAVQGPVTVILRTAADDAPWEQVLSSIVVQATEAAAFTVLARVDSSPALLMAEKPDADGDAVVAASAAAVYNSAGNVLDGRRVRLDCGGEVVFERAAGLWAVGVTGPRDGATPAAQVNLEAARAIGEALVEYDVHGRVVVAFIATGEDAARAVALADALGIDVSRISDDAAYSTAVLAL